MAENNIKSIGKKWVLGLMIFLWGCIVLCGYIIFSIININKYNDLSNKIDKILIQSQKCTLAAKEFLMNAYSDESFVMTGSNQSYLTFNAGIDTLLILADEFEKSGYIDTDKKKQRMSSLKSSLSSYKADFVVISQLFKEKGFKDLGLEGKMRAAIHFIEKHEAPIDLEYLLTLRRHEKDFLLRKDIGYISKFDEEIKVFESHIVNHPKIYPEYHRKELLEALKTYEQIFFEITEIEKRIGLKSTDGLRAGLSQNLFTIEHILNEFNTDIKNEKIKASYAVNIIIGSIVVVFILIIAGVVYSINYFNQSVLKPIQYLNHAAVQIAQGNLSVSLDFIKKKKLLSDLVNSYEKLVEKLRLTIWQIEQISTRKIKNALQLHNEQDEIGISLNRVIDEIARLDNEEAKRTWTAEGMAKFGEAVRNSKNMESLCDNALQFLVKYTKSNQGGLFLVQNNMSDKEVLVLIAAYAYQRKKYINKEIFPGEGMVGQCFFEKDVIYLTDIPEDYIKITSGLGEATPRAVLIVPMMASGKAEAILEIASFNEFEPYQIEYLQKSGEILAATIAGMRVTATTARLLEETESKSEQMKSQEEEMRQNVEELLATQEELVRKDSEYKQKIELLEQGNAALKLQNQEMSKKLSLMELAVASRDNSKTTEANKHMREEIHRATKYPRRIEHFLDS